MNLSNLFGLNVKDFFNGLITAVIGALVTYLFGVFQALYQLAITGQAFKITVDFQSMIVIGVFAGLSYIVKRYFSDSTGTVLGSTPTPPAVQ